MEMEGAEAAGAEAGAAAVMTTTNSMTVPIYGLSERS
jgi:hypothetical protein